MSMYVSVNVWVSVCVCTMFLYTFACAYQCVSYYKMENDIVGCEAFVIKSVFSKKINNYLTLGAAMSAVCHYCNISSCSQDQGC